MSAGGSAGGSTAFVWIKLATAVEDAFAKVFYAPGQDVADVASLACKAFPRWRLDAGQVRLFLAAKAGAPKPQLPALEACKDLAPLAEEAALESAGVTSGAWLVAAPTAPADLAGAAAVPWTVNRLRALLVEAGAPVDESLVRRIVSSRALQGSLSFCSTAADVAQFCQTIGAEPQSETRAAVLGETGVCIDGDIYVPHRTTALFKRVFDGAVPCVLKIPSGRAAAVQRECRLYSELGAAAEKGKIGLVPVRPLTLRGAHHAGADRESTPPSAGILMPSYPLTLAQAPPQVALRQGARMLARLEVALDFLAAHGWVHGDVKPSNIFLSGSTGEPWLGDFGSSVRAAEARAEFQGGTPSFQVQGVAVGAPGAAFDRAGLVVSLLAAAGVLEAGSRGSLAWPRQVVQAAIARLRGLEGGGSLGAALHAALARVP